MAVKRHLGGWHPDAPDYRDQCALLMLGLEVGATKLPRIYDTRPTQPPIYDQGQQGSCVFNAWARMVHFTEKEIVGGKKRPIPSRKFSYYNGRMEQGTVKQDSGSSLRMGGMVHVKYGYVYDDVCPYASDMYKAPSKMAYEQGGKHKLGQIMIGRVQQDLQHLKTVLADNNLIVFGFTVFSSFMKTGKDGMVNPRGGSNEGGHALCIVGYDDVKKLFIVANSWGAKWGDAGYCYWKYEDILDAGLCSDFWTLTALPALDDAA